MPKYLKVCNNPLHEGWSGGKCSRVLNLRAYNLDGLSRAFANFILEETGKCLQIKQICCTCIRQSLKKRSVTKHLPKQLPTEAIEKKVRHIQ